MADGDSVHSPHFRGPEKVRSSLRPGARSAATLALGLAVCGCGEGSDPAASKFEVRPADLTVSLGGGVRLEMVLVPPGEFAMCDGAAAHAERVTEPFYLGRFEVTEEQWVAVVGALPSEFPGDSHGARFPVRHLTFEQCTAFVDRLNATQGQGGFMIPSEAQWEIACRAGTTTKWSCGDDESTLSDYAWHSGGASGSDRGGRRDIGEVQPVGTKRPNAWGFFDMHGNVAEWCADPWRLYTDTLDGNGRQFYLEDTDLRVVRGGSVESSADEVRSGTRAHGPRVSQRGLFAVGLRVARSASE